VYSKRGAARIVSMEANKVADVMSEDEKIEFQISIRKLMERYEGRVAWYYGLDLSKLSA
jgi:hypothetical protein